MIGVRISALFAPVFIVFGLTTSTAHAGGVGCYTDAVVGQMENLVKAPNPDYPEIRKIAGGMAAFLQTFLPKNRSQDATAAPLDGYFSVVEMRRIVDAAATIGNGSAAQGEVANKIRFIRGIWQAQMDAICNGGNCTGGARGRPTKLQAHD